MQTMQTFLADNAKAVVLIVHGSGEHIGRYQHVAKWLNQHNITVVGGDLPGLGTSTEKRGHIANFNDYLTKVDEWLANIQETWNNLPIFILGHSLGGLIVLRYLEGLGDSSQLTGAIVTSPAIEIRVKIPKWQLATAKVLTRIWPTLRLKSGVQAIHVSRDPIIVEKYRKDPLNYGKVSLSWFIEFQKAMQLVWEESERIKQLNIPLLYLQAGGDLIVNPEAAERLINRINSEEITFQKIPELYHEILNEPEKEIYLELMTDWIAGKIESM